MGLNFIDAGYEPQVEVATKSPEAPKVQYPKLHLDGKAFSSIASSVGEDVMFMIKGKVTGIRKDEYGECVDVEVCEVGTYDKEDNETKEKVEVMVSGNDADKSLSKLKGSL